LHNRKNSEQELFVDVQRLKDDIAMSKSKGEEEMTKLSKELEELLNELAKVEHTRNEVR
jgi:CRISPR/Cas system CSM-associated protein Csm2 small subunit